MTENDRGRPDGGPRALPDLSPPFVAREGVVHQTREAFVTAVSVYDAIADGDYAYAMEAAAALEDRLEAITSALEHALGADLPLKLVHLASRSPEPRPDRVDEPERMSPDEWAPIRRDLVARGWLTEREEQRAAA